ncbi:hypothetical protein ACFWJ4_34435 [Kitasatospora sp. NPDC127067]|uniref:hypothetical protein n=1 Tax=Kitasatospora sp. NPDC127067 TaxID=3347126 RepID=UPI0036674A68
MSTTRRSLLGAALGAPLLGWLTGTAAGAVDGGTDRSGNLGTLSNGWVEVRWTPEAQAQLDRFHAMVDVVAPARMVMDRHGPAVHLPIRSAVGDPSLANPPKAHGDGALDGGVSVRTSRGDYRVVNLAGAIKDGLGSGRCEVGGAEMGHRSAFRCGLTEGKLTADPVPAGHPIKVRLTGVPLRPTQEAVDAYTANFGAHPVTVDTVLAYVTAQGTYTPPPPAAAQEQHS